MTAAIALAGAVDGGVLRAAGWQVRGSLHLTPYSLLPGGLRDVPSYPGIEDLLADVTLNAVALDGGDDLLARHLPALLERGLHVLLPEPAPLDPAILRDARSVESPAEVAVGFLERWEPWALTAAAAIPAVGTAVVQATVRGWPRGVSAAAELVDLARSWCGDVVAATAAPAPLPAPLLEPGVPVAWSLLHASGATTLVSHEGAPTVARLSFDTARLEVGPLGARWVGGAEIPLQSTPDRRDIPFAAAIPPGTARGLLGCAVDLLHAVPTAEIATGQWPWPADLGDLQAASRVLAALRESARSEAPARVA